MTNPEHPNDEAVARFLLDRALLPLAIKAACKTYPRPRAVVGYLNSGLTQKEVGKYFGLSGTRIGQILNEAAERLTAEVVAATTATLRAEADAAESRAQRAEARVEQLEEALRTITAAAWEVRIPLDR